MQDTVKSCIKDYFEFSYLFLCSLYVFTSLSKIWILDMLAKRWHTVVSAFSFSWLADVFKCVSPFEKPDYFSLIVFIDRRLWKTYIEHQSPRVILLLYLSSGSVDIMHLKLAHRSRISPNDRTLNPSCRFFRLQLYLPLSLPVPHSTGLQHQWEVIDGAGGFVGWLDWDGHKCGEKKFVVHTKYTWLCYCFIGLKNP